MRGDPHLKPRSRIDLRQIFREDGVLLRLKWQLPAVPHPLVVGPAGNYRSDCKGGKVCAFCAVYIRWRLTHVVDPLFSCRWRCCAGSRFCRGSSGSKPRRSACPGIPFGCETNPGDCGRGSWCGRPTACDCSRSQLCSGLCPLPAAHEDHSAGQRSLHLLPRRGAGLHSSLLHGKSDRLLPSRLPRPAGGHV